MRGILKRFLGRRYSEARHEQCTFRECPIRNESETRRHRVMEDELQEVMARLEQLDLEADVIARRRRDR